MGLSDLKRWRSGLIYFTRRSPSLLPASRRRLRFTLTLQRLRYGAHLLDVAVQGIDQIVAHGVSELQRAVAAKT